MSASQCKSDEVERKRKSVSFHIIDNEKAKKPKKPFYYMRNSVLDSKSSRVLNFPLTVEQQIWLMFLIPAIVQTAFYIVDVSTDISIGIQLIKEGHKWAGLVTILITYTAPLISYVCNLANPPAENEIYALTAWFIQETTAFVLYPLRPVWCFGERLFWSIEAARLPDPMREEALISFETTKRFALENYFFFQGILHAGPQAIFQTILLVFGVTRNRNTELMQVFGILTSLLSLSLVTTSYQRYETQARGGRKRVWPRLDERRRSYEEPQVLLAIQGGPDHSIPRRRHTTKVMDEDNPLGTVVSFLFWFLFLFGRVFSLVIAASFSPWAVLGVCLAHYMFTLLYIIPSPNCASSLFTKILLSIVFIFCLVEVGIQFRKSLLFYSLFFIFTVVENFCLTLMWVLWANWTGLWYFYCLYFLVISHVLAIVFACIYCKFFQPSIRRLQPYQ